MDEEKPFELDKHSHKQYSDFIKKYYPKTAVNGLVGFSGEYNDESTDYTTAFVIAFDKDGTEVSPLKEFVIQARSAATDLYLPDAYDSENQWTEDGDAVELPYNIPFEVLP